MIKLQDSEQFVFSKNKSIFFALVFLLFTRIFINFSLNIAQDEAYYLSWARFLSFGYLDHPPMIAWLGTLGRWGVIALGVLFSVIGLLFFQKITRNKIDKEKYFLLANYSLSSLVFFQLLTPDAPYYFFWTLAVLFGVFVLEQRQIKSWHCVLLGAVLAAMSYSKYLSVLFIFPLLYLFFAKEIRAKSNIAKFIFVAICFLGIFSPHIYWNAKNDWASFRFQLVHRFAKTEGLFLADRERDLAHAPLKLEADDFKKTTEFQIYEKLKLLKQEELAKVEKERIDGFEGLSYKPTFARPFELFLAQIISLGFIGFILIYGVWKKRKNLKSTILSDKINLSKQSQYFLHICTLTPLLFWLPLAFLIKVEANWPAIFLISAVPFLSQFFTLKQLRWGSASNIVLLLIVALHAKFHILPINQEQDRLRIESEGFSELAQLLDMEAHPLYAETYQLTAMMRYYLPSKPIAQGPLLARPSEYTRNILFRSNSANAHLNGFILVQNRERPFVFEQYQAVSLNYIIDCGQSQRVRGLTNFRIDLEKSLPELFDATLCARPVHRWYLYRYEAKKDKA